MDVTPFQQLPVTWVSAGGQAILSTKLAAGDANPAFQIDGDGTLHWGAGGANAVDCRLHRQNNQQMVSDGHAGWVLTGTDGNGVSLAANGALSGNHMIANGCSIYAGAGAPAAGQGANGDIYLRTDGGAGTTIYQKRAGAWVATAA